MGKYAAIIVSYNPELGLLEKNVNAVASQVDKVIIYDNNSANQDAVYCKFNDDNHVCVIRSKTNNGISKAINDSVKQLSEDFSWFITLDQDSVSPSNMIEEYSKYVNLEGVKMISPRVQLEVGREIQQQKTTEPVEYIKRCITSACFVNADAFKLVGGLDESMFIDWVDHDICKNFDVHGFKMLQCNHVILYHNLGSSDPVKSSVWLHKHFGTKIIYQTYSPFRIYYMVRNSIYYIRKYKGHLDKGEKRNVWMLIVQHVGLKSIITGDKKWSILKAYFKGVYDGFRMPVNIDKKYF